MTDPLTGDVDHLRLRMTMQRAGGVHAGMTDRTNSTEAGIQSTEAGLRKARIHASREGWPRKVHMSVIVQSTTIADDELKLRSLGGIGVAEDQGCRRNGCENDRFHGQVLPVVGGIEELCLPRLTHSAIAMRRGDNLSGTICRTWNDDQTVTRVNIDMTLVHRRCIAGAVTGRICGARLQRRRRFESTRRISGSSPARSH